ncbi:NHL repeat domain protein [hydrothermal vent metagenome]|uniref:NHL repeat domain protein n=1 Tax=hydrothermal vent metagenome TaxID=652676 RepID=A0A3B1B4Z0_9ZZZZ
MNNTRQNIMILLAGFVLFLNACTVTSDKVEKETVIPVFPLPPEKPRFIYERTIRSSIDVVKEDSTNAFRRFATGEQLHGEGFAKPFGISVDKGRIFIGDTVRRIVMVMDPAGEGKYFEIGKDEPGRLFMPLGLAQDAAGNLYVCDGTAKRVTIYDRDGKYLRVLGGKDYFSRPSGVAVDPEGTRVYVVDTGGVESNNHRVRVFDAHSGKHLFDIGTRGSGDGEFNLPRDAVVSPYNHHLYVVDGGNFRVQIFDMDGKFIGKFGGIGRRTGQFSRPKGIAVDKWGNVYVVDTAFGNVQLFSPDGKLLMYLGNRGSSDKPAKYMLPSGVAIDETDGRVYIVDQFFRKVDIFKPTKLMGPADSMNGIKNNQPDKKSSADNKPSS